MVNIDQMTNIEFRQPQTLKEALRLLSESGKNARLIAGGTDVIPGMRQGSVRFKDISHLIDIHHLEELNFISKEKDVLRIGAASTFSNISNHKVIAKSFPVLADAARHIGSVQIRNRATIAGNFVNNAPCADSVPALLVHNARIKIISPADQRELLLDKFLKGPYKTALKPTELVSEIEVPIDTQNYKGVFYKLGRRRGVAVSRISLAILLKMSRKKITDIRIASGAVTPVGMRFPNLEKALTGKDVDLEMLKKFAHQLGKEILQATGLRWSTPYKLPVIQQIFFQLMCDLTGTKI
jgi:xanthine dehydrogenase FAD-binding subunit